jgi:hypothetical protein
MLHPDLFQMVGKIDPGLLLEKLGNIDFRQLKPFGNHGQAQIGMKIGIFQKLYDFLPELMIMSLFPGVDRLAYLLDGSDKP